MIAHVSERFFHQKESFISYAAYENNLISYPLSNMVYTIYTMPLVKV